MILQILLLHPYVIVIYLKSWSYNGFWALWDSIRLHMDGPE